jgi:hypothetical protein
MSDDETYTTPSFGASGSGVRGHDVFVAQWAGRRENSEGTENE